MKSRKSIILNVLFFTILILLTYYIIFKDYSLKEIFNNLKGLNYNYLLLAIIFMFLYFVLEALNIKLLLNSFKEKISLFKSTIYAFICFFFSAITPGGSGGQPIAIYYLSKENIKMSNSTLAYLIQLLGYNISALVIGLLSAALHPEVFDGRLSLIFCVGSVLILIPISLTVIGIFSKRLSNFLVNLLIKVLTKLRVKKIDTIKEKITTELEVFHNSRSYIKTHKMEFVRSVLISLAQLLTSYVVPFFIYKSFGLSGYSILFFIGLQAILHNSSASIPLPGAVGITESAFLLIYSYIYTIGLVHSSLIVTRIITFYLFVLLSLIIFIITQAISKKQND